MPRCAARASPESLGNSITCQKDSAGEKHQKHIFFFSRSIFLLRCIQKNASRQNILPQRRRAMWMDWRFVMGILSIFMPTIQYLILLNIEWLFLLGTYIYYKNICNAVYQGHLFELFHDDEY